jgi:PadR family transcriptional regulator, regulatory protein PadR
MFLWVSNMTLTDKNNPERNPVWQGTLSLMVLRTLLTMGEQHGYGIARRIEQTSNGRLSINYGTLYPALLKLEQEGLIASSWGVSENNRKAKFYKLTKAGRKQIERDTREWEAMSAIMTRFLAAGGE